MGAAGLLVGRDSSALFRMAEAEGAEVGAVVTLAGRGPAAVWTDGLILGAGAGCVCVGSGGAEACCGTGRLRVAAAAFFDPWGTAAEGAGHSSAISSPGGAMLAGQAVVFLLEACASAGKCEDATNGEVRKGALCC